MSAGSSQYKSGYLPYAIVVGWQQLAKDFAYWRASSIGAKTAVDAADRAWFDADREHRKLLLLRDLGYWSHFPGDASMPLHTSVHFYGWGPYPNPQGYATGDSHGLYIKGAFVRHNISRDVVKSLRPALRRLQLLDLGARVQDDPGQNKLVIPMYELDKKGAFEAATPKPSPWCRRSWPGRGRFATWSSTPGRQARHLSVGDPVISMRDILSGKHILRRDDLHYD